MYKDTATGEIISLTEIFDRYLQINETYKGFEEYVDSGFVNGNETEYVLVGEDVAVWEDGERIY